MSDNITTGWGALGALWFISSLTFMLWLFANIVLGIIIGAFTGWLLSYTFLGHWAVDGLNAFGPKLNPWELHKIGATAGFLSGFMKFSFRPDRRPQELGRQR